MSRLSNALFTTTQQKVLGLLYVNPEKSFYTRQILRMTGMGVATIKRELDRMLSAGIITLTRIGNQHHYQANPECPIYQELLSIARKTFGVAEVLRDALAPMRDSISYVFIYGSIAKGTDQAKSDVDLMVIGDNLSYSEIMEILMPVEEKLGRTVSPTVYSDTDFIRKLNDGNSFLNRVMQQEKISIIGSKDDVRKTG